VRLLLTTGKEAGVGKVYVKVGVALTNAAPAITPGSPSFNFEVLVKSSLIAQAVGVLITFPEPSISSTLLATANE